MLRFTCPSFQPWMFLAVAFGLAGSPAVAADLSAYRGLHFGDNLPAIAKQIDVAPTQAKTLHTRPALLQQLAWQPRPLGPSSVSEAVQDVALYFYNGQLFRIDVTYDRYETEGLTEQDIIGALSATYGPGTPVAAAPAQRDTTGEEEQITIARWQDARYRFDLMRSAYGSRYSVKGMDQSLSVLAAKASLEAARLDLEEAPAREAAQAASDENAEKLRLEKVRLANKLKFKP